MAQADQKGSQGGYSSLPVPLELIIAGSANTKFEIEHFGELARALQPADPARAAVLEARLWLIGLRYRLSTELRSEVGGRAATYARFMRAAALLREAKDILEPLSTPYLFALLQGAWARDEHASLRSVQAIESACLQLADLADTGVENRLLAIRADAVCRLFVTITDALRAEVGGGTRLWRDEWSFSRARQKAVRDWFAVVDPNLLAGTRKSLIDRTRRGLEDNPAKWAEVRKAVRVTWPFAVTLPEGW